MPDTGLQIALDTLNPGQFFACCGLFELLSWEEPGLLSHFALDSGQPRVATFCIQTRCAEPLRTVLARLRQARVTFSNDDKLGGAVKPAVIAYDKFELGLDWWFDEFRDKTTNIKCWAGQVTTRRLLQELLPLLDVDCTAANLFFKSALTNSLFGLDPRSAWNTLDLGFSPNEHNVASTVFPAVEVLGAVGLQYFRPDSSKRSEVRYALWKDLLPATVARLAFAAPWDGLAVESFAFEICKRGQSYKYFSFAQRAEKETTKQ